MVIAFIRGLRDDIDDMFISGKLTVKGNSFMTHLVSMYWGCRGIPENLTDLCMFPLFIKMGVKTARGNYLASMVWTPWAMKPLFAVTSDLIPFAYYKKRWYMMCVSGFGTLGAFLLWTSSLEALGGESANVAYIYFFLVNVAIAMCDSLTQGKYTEVCKAKGATVVSFVSGCKTSAGMVASMFGPYINDRNPQLNMGLCMPFFLQAGAVQAMNFMGDKRLEEPCTPDCSTMKKDKNIIVLGLTLGIFSLVLALLSLVEIGDIALADYTIYIASAGACVILGMTFWALPHKIAMINVYIIFCRVATLDLRYALQQWYTSHDNCPDSPAFTNTVYQTMGNVTSNLATLFGVYIFELYVSHWNARRAFWVTTGFTMIGALFDLSMLTGFNRTLQSIFPWSGEMTTFNGFLNEQDADTGNVSVIRMIRWDDLFGFLFGSQALKYLATTLDDMPATVLLSKLCPVGVETTVFAILAALQNLGFQVSGLYGSAILGAAGVDIGSEDRVFQVLNETTGEPMNITKDVPYCNLGTGWFGMSGITFCVFMGGIILPLTTIPATFVLIPDQRLDEDFTGDASELELQDVSADPAGASIQELQRASFLSLGRGVGSRVL